MKHSGIEWIGEIPKGWRILQVKNLCQISRGRVIPITDMDDSYTYPVYSSQTKNNGCMGYINTYDYNGDALTWTTDGANAGTMFYRTGLFNCTNVCGILQQKQIDIKSDIKFLLYSIGFSARHNRRLDINGFKIMSNEMAEIKFVLPSLSEQQKIANYLDKVCGEMDEIIALQEQMIEELKAYKQSVITEAVTKGLNPDVPMRDSGIDWIGEIPEHWKIERLKFLCSIQTGNQDTQDARQDGEYPFYVRSPKVEHSSKCSFEGEGILMAGDGAGAGRVFHHAFGKYAVHQRVYRLSEFSNKIDTNYLFHYISSLFCKVMDMGSAQSTVPSVRLPMLLNFVVCTPHLSEQQSIASYLDTKCTEIDALIAIKQAKIEELKDYKKSVIYEYVTGKKEVV